MKYEDSKFRIFLVLAQEGSFTKAAKKLGISQPAISQSIAELERTYGKKLFDRDRMGVSITPEGLSFKTYAQNILSAYSSASLYAEDKNIALQLVYNIIPTVRQLDPSLADFLIDSLESYAKTK